MNQSADAVPALARKALYMDTPTIVALISLLVTFAGGLLSGFKYFGAEIASVRKEAALLVAATGESESKARHALGNSVMGSMGKLEADYRLLRDSMNALALDAVRKADLAGFELRLMNAITTSEARFASALDRMDSSRTATLSHMEGKLDRLIEGRQPSDRQ